MLFKTPLDHTGRGTRTLTKTNPLYYILGFGQGYTEKTLKDITGKSDRVLTSTTADELKKLVDELVEKFCESGESVNPLGRTAQRELRMPHIREYKTSKSPQRRLQRFTPLTHKLEASNS